MADDMVDKTQEDLLKSDIYKKYKELFKDAAEQMTSRRYLVKGYATHIVKSPMLGEVEIRTLTKKERDFCEIYAAGFPSQSEKDSARSKMTLVFAITKISNQEMLIAAPDKNSDMKKWLEMPAVDEKIKMVDNLSEFDEDTILSEFMDLRLFSRLYILDLQKNPLTPQKQ